MYRPLTRVALRYRSRATRPLPQGERARAFAAPSCYNPAMPRAPTHSLLFAAALALALTAAADARAADAGKGKRLAQDHCAACHIVAPSGRREVAISPPFEVIGRKYAFDADRIAHAIAGPHPKMNFSPSAAEAAGIAAYIATLKQ